MPFDDQRIVTGSLDQTAKVWDAATGRELLTLKGHTLGIQSVALSANGQRIVTGSDDGTAKVWQAATAQQVAAWQEEERVPSQHLGRVGASRGRESDFLRRPKLLV